jgi:ankyrin repeat protein
MAFSAWADELPYKNEDPEVIQLLIEAGYNFWDHPNYMFYTNPWSVLITGKVPMPFFERLLALGVTVESASDRLIGAISSNYLEAVNFFIEHGANVNYEDNQKRTPLHFAVDVEDVRILRRLIAAGAIVIPDVFGYTPLHRAVHSREKIELLLANRADANAVTSRGLTPLMIAVSRPNCTDEIIQTLLAAGANVNAADPTGQSVLILAARNTARPAVITLLLNAGANAKLEDNTGRTALDWFDQNRNRWVREDPVRRDLRDRM